MPDFSDKYKNALEYQEISPDFKERTARLMTELRDSEKLIPETAEENLPLAEHISVSGNEIKTSRRIKLIKVISTAAAAAACLTVGVALNNAGVFDKDSDPSVIATDGIVTEATDIIEAEITADESFSEDVLTTEGAAISEYAETTAPETISQTASQSVNETEAVTEISAVTETKADTKTQAAAISAETTSAPGEGPAAEDVDEMIEEVPVGAAPEAPVEAAPVEGAGIAPYAYDNGENENKLPLETVLILEPFSEEAEAEEEADSENDEEIVEEAPTDITSAADRSRAASFSPKEAVSEFPAQNSTAVITPTFEDINSEDGTVVTYESKEVRSVTKLLNLNKELSAYAEEGEGSLAEEAPSDSRYIIDYADKQGNAMRIYMGSRYICFAYGGSFYTFELTEEEYNELDGVLFGLIS
ncbi:hypothetical protein [Huintestinicola sp.]|uniref:hypothetical protein n=1 Tax=Huintestinicola sp. TaxID=2981661 RepID=UPI003D7C4D9A